LPGGGGGSLGGTVVHRSLPLRVLLLLPAGDPASAARPDRRARQAVRRPLLVLPRGLACGPRRRVIDRGLRRGDSLRRLPSEPARPSGGAGRVAVRGGGFEFPVVQAGRSWVA